MTQNRIQIMVNRLLIANIRTEHNYEIILQKLHPIRTS